ncbi:cytochrome P450 [Gymnopus androsaceus JB14]|uniref:Cytochrome P450 n=1 Tax=Gymnopus androsaceus JB14 TaxID=1447944 RepID=A0A6A4HCU1_9AGAR|nr:cytochrome P450 [Gymnopus androsaceus JB14]
MVFLGSGTPIKLRGPPNPSFLFGNLKETWFSTTPIGEPNLQEKWHERYGHTISTRSGFGAQRIVTTDAKAIQHIMRNEHIYGKPQGNLRILKLILGEGSGSGIFVAEGEKHKLQRKVMNPAFAANQIRELTGTFFEKSFELRDIWAAKITSASGVGEIDSVDWLSKTTLDVIGLTGFNYHFNALNDTGKVNELNKAFSAIFGSSDMTSVWIPLQAQLPKAIKPLLMAFARTSGAMAAMKSSAEIMQRTGKELLAESKAYLAGTGEKNDNWGARDLLSLLLKSNMSTDIPEDERMSDADVIAQVPTFLIAGHETTSVSTTWALFSLSRHQEIQTKLREELLSVPTEKPSMDVLNELPYLDAFVRETLRLYTPLTNVARIALQDDIIPLAHPITDSDGVVHDSLPVRKDQPLIIAVLGVNTDKTLWGSDAYEFRPDRWLKIPDDVHTIPGVWSNLMTFWGGSRACIGWRFSIIEMKALLFTLVRSFEFELAVPVEEIILHRVASMQRPSLSSDDSRAKLPLLIKPLKS